MQKTVNNAVQVLDGAWRLFPDPDNTGKHKRWFTAIPGKALWTFWRELKPGIADVLRDGWAPLRWCLFVRPGHSYAGRDYLCCLCGGV